MVEFAIQAFISLFVVVDPIGIVPIFIALTGGFTSEERMQIALRACLIAFAVLLLFALAGGQVLALLGIGLPAFRIAGGIALLIIALEMLFERREIRRKRSVRKKKRENPKPKDQARLTEIAVFPLAIPLIAGPSTMTTILLLGEEHQRFWPYGAILIGAIGLTLFTGGILFALSPLVARVMGERGMALVQRLLGLILCALAVQFVLDGIAEYVALVMSSGLSG